MEAIARTLRSHNVILVWRDTAPAGQCEGGTIVTTQWTSYYEKFKAMNAVARRFVLRHGGHVLPHVWDNGVGRDGDHVYGPHGDALHWCNYSPQSVQWMWMTVLYNELDAILAKGAATNVSEPSKSKRKGVEAQKSSRWAAAPRGPERTAVWWTNSDGAAVGCGCCVKCKRRGRSCIAVAPATATRGAWGVWVCLKRSVTANSGST
jgi:hypothetical protein